MEDIDPHVHINDARAFLRSHLEGELQFDEHVRPLKVVVDTDGLIVAPVMVAMIESANTVLFLPHADEHAMQLLVTLDPFEEAGPDGGRSDRWRIYHGEPDDVRWAILHVDAARFHGSVLDGDALRAANALGQIEPAMCREVNTGRRDDLRALVRTRAKLNLDNPVLVGVDQYGMDVRGPFDVIRVPFDTVLDTAEAAEQQLRAMLDEAARTG